MPQNKKQKLAPGGEAERLVKMCHGLLRNLQKLPTALPFLSPVDWKALKLPTYPKMIRNPMDLGTIEQKLMAGRYATVVDFGSDLHLIWSNAHLFNLDGSDIYVAATHMATECEQRMRSIPDGPLRDGGGGSGSGGGGGMTSDELAQCKTLLRELKKRDQADPFLVPVDWKGLGIMDYPTIIKRPMDLGTVSAQLDAGHYSSVRDVAADVELVWNNAMTYNVDDSWIHQAARKLQTWTQGKFAPLLSAASRDEPDAPTELTFEMKHRLNQNANQLSSKDLYGMVGIVEENCKRALDQTNPQVRDVLSQSCRHGRAATPLELHVGTLPASLPHQEVEIDIDTLDLQTFLKVDKYVQDCLARAKKNRK